MLGGSKFPSLNYLEKNTGLLFGIFSAMAEV